MCILEPYVRHPAAPLLAWLAATIAVQFVGWAGLLVLAGALVLAGTAVRRRWWCLVRRARWLLLTLGLILAYATPGEALIDAVWSPTDAGIEAAGLHGLRLGLMLGLLAWLFERLDRTRLVAGLWAAAQPGKAFGVAADRAVVRLALVFDYLEKEPPRGSWRQVLQDHGGDREGPEVIRLDLAPWNSADSRWLAGCGLLLLAVAVLP